MAKPVTVDVTFPCGQTQRVRSIRAVARMLSGYGTQSGGFRKTISKRALRGLDAQLGNVVRNCALAG
jgi:hypothetical protein